MDDFLGNLFGRVEQESLKKQEAQARRDVMSRVATILRKSHLVRSVQRSESAVVVVFDCPSIVSEAGECHPLELQAA